MRKRTKPWIAPQFASLFTSGRPAIPWEIADIINVVLHDHAIESVGVAGSLHPSVLVALGYDAPARKLNAFSDSAWRDAESWNIVLGDSPGMEKERPWAHMYLPVHFNLWDGGTPFFRSQAIFADLPFDHPLVNLTNKHLDLCEHPLVLLGFMEGHDGPDDLVGWLDDRHYLLTEHTGTTRVPEGPGTLDYKLIVATK